ncbi:hypothetical protein A9Q79_02485 [Methylophaga sp. 42_25_T18]|nr:hypothetical protein A9Q79_02485 [Methylophaga sp. 42_25_T18]OUR89238.1 hypothetical protein A9Q92_01280 [Methylophaga sp. 42_8_T64]
MKLFVYEHITSGALAAQDLPESLAQEGDSMLTTILQDLAEQPQLELFILRDSRLAEIDSLPHHSSCELFWVQNTEQFDQQWEAAIQQADNTLVIAPETDAQLTKIQQDISDRDKTYLGSSQKATLISTDKLRCSQHLLAHDIATVKTQTVTQWQKYSVDNADGFVIKPIDGAGCLDTMLFQTTDEADDYLQKMSPDQLLSLIVQPYIKGSAASLSLFISDNMVNLLSINRQKIKQQKSQLIFCGCDVNAISASELSQRDAQQIADEIYKALPGLWGFVGIDLVLTSSGPIVIEINPRLTTSYIGLKSTLSFNPTDLLIKHMHEKTPTRLAS